MEDITTKKSSFNEIFDANDPVGQNDENPLSMAAQSLASAEKSILKKSRLSRKPGQPEPGIRCRRTRLEFRI